MRSTTTSTRLFADCESVFSPGEWVGRCHQTRDAQDQNADCDKKLKKYRATLEADGDPTVIAARMAEVQKERRALEIELGQLTPPEVLSHEKIRNFILTLSDIALR